MSQPPHQHEHLAAYFCMEFALHEEFPIYSGGLGVLAGDAIKSAGDLKLPLVAVGLFWNEGYTTQRIDADGRPYDEYPPCPAEHTRDTGVRISVDVAGEEKRLVFQAVHMILEGDLQRPWKDGEPRYSRMVFIGRNLDEAAPKAGFEACAA